jgi:hypothetical protein
MALKFLSKKRWHVRRLENIKKVAEAEAKQAEEQSRMAELRRELEEEREMEAIRRLQEASGRIPKQKPRLEFLYKTPTIRKPTEEEMPTREDILAGRRRDAIMQSDAVTEGTGTAVPGVKWVDALRQLKGEDDIRTREDPMTAIVAKRQIEKQGAEQRRELLMKLQEDDGARHSRRRHRR